MPYTISSVLEEERIISLRIRIHTLEAALLDIGTIAASPIYREESQRGYGDIEEIVGDVLADRPVSKENLEQARDTFLWLTNVTKKSDMPPARLWCSYPDCPCEREYGGVCQYKHPDTFSCDVCGERKPSKERRRGYPYGEHVNYCSTCLETVEDYAEDSIGERSDD